MRISDGSSDVCSSDLGQDARSLEAVGAEVVLPLGSTAPGVGRLLSERVAVLQALERVVDAGAAVAVRRGLLHRRDAVHEPLSALRPGVAVPTAVGDAVLAAVQVAAADTSPHDRTHKTRPELVAAAVVAERGPT